MIGSLYVSPFGPIKSLPKSSSINPQMPSVFRINEAVGANWTLMYWRAIFGLYPTFIDTVTPEMRFRFTVKTSYVTYTVCIRLATVTKTDNNKIRESIFRKLSESRSTSSLTTWLIEKFRKPVRNSAVEGNLH